MTCLIDSALIGAGMKSHTSMFGMYLYMYLGNKYADFQEKIFAEISEYKKKCPNFEVCDPPSAPSTHMDTPFRTLIVSTMRVRKGVPMSVGLGG